MKAVTIPGAQYIRIDEASRLTGICPKTLRNMASAGRVPCYKVAGLLFKASELEEWMQSKKVLTADQARSQVQTYIATSNRRRQIKKHISTNI